MKGNSQKCLRHSDTILRQLVHGGVTKKPSDAEVRKSLKAQGCVRCDDFRVLTL